MNLKERFLRRFFPLEYSLKVFICKKESTENELAT